MKKILIFSLTYHPFIGGAEIAIKEITDRINKDDISFDLITLRFDSSLPKKETIGNITVYRTGFSRKNPTQKDLKKFPLHLNKFIFQFSSVFRAILLHRKNKYDGIWAMMAHSTGVPAGIFKTIYPEVPYLLTLQEGDPINKIKRTMRPVYPFFVRGFTKADFVQAISNYLGKWSRDMGFKGPLEVIPNAVDVKHFSQEYPESELQTLKQKLGKKEGDVYLITTSRLVKKNAVDDVIKSLEYLPENISFIVLGIGPDKDILLKLSEDKGVKDRVKFLDHISHREIPKYLKISDIFIRPSLSEGMGNSFIEAMAAGIPLIATHEGGIVDFLFDPECNPDKKSTGRMVNTRDPEGIADAVKLYLGDKEKTQEIIKNAKELTFAKYDWNLIAKNMKEKVFDKLLK